MSHAFLPRPLPEALRELAELALDLRWTWSHASDSLWRTLSPESWERTRNPWVILQDVPRTRLDQSAADPEFCEELAALVETRRRYLADEGWYGRVHAGEGLRGVAYFSMEFGLGEALPLYAGGLGVLAGDYLKTASDLGVPVVGVGLLWQVGYFRQMLDPDGRQQESFPYNDPTGMPIQPVLSDSGGWLEVALELPGRTLLLRVWRAQVGRVPLYLLDSNDQLNSPADRGITSELYGGGPEMRLLQELALGIGGWRLLQLLGLPIDVCHLNEGHAAFVALERARRFIADHEGVTFWDAIWATRAGNIFTTHTSVPAGFDLFAPDLITKYFPQHGHYLDQLGLTPDDLLALGRRNPRDASEPFNMAHLALRGSNIVNGVSRLHGAVSRRLFQSHYAGWPEHEVPIGHVTNGVHTPSWDSRWSDTLWTNACGKGRWCEMADDLPPAIGMVTDEMLWTLRGEQRRDLVRKARERLAEQLGQRGADLATVSDARRVLDPNALTLGFARRFASYKRPNLLLHDRTRLARLLGSSDYPVQIIVAGKAHPRDEEGKCLVQEWVRFVQQPEVRSHAVFLEDYDISLAQDLVQGVDVWINTPRRPFEACGTSGMKVLVNGGLNVSELDGWWAEAASPEVGWILGDGREHAGTDRDAREAEALYRLLEQEVVPAFYERDAQGLPRAWLTRVRESMARLAPHFSANRMLREYVEGAYIHAADACQKRCQDGGRLARELRTWYTGLERHWHEVRFSDVAVHREGERWQVRAQVILGGVMPSSVRVELYADALDTEHQAFRAPMEQEAAIPGTTNGYVYVGTAPASRPAEHFTPRVLAYHPDAGVPAEAAFIRWSR